MGCDMTTEKEDVQKNPSESNEIPTSREAERRAIDAKFIAAGHAPENTACNHRHYDSKKHGRHCTCGTVMWDAGD